MLTLADAIEQDRLDEFAEQADARLAEMGFPPPAEDAVLAEIERNAKPRPA
jgi:hypothetical protein